MIKKFLSSLLLAILILTAFSACGKVRAKTKSQQGASSETLDQLSLKMKKAAEEDGVAASEPLSSPGEISPDSSKNISSAVPTVEKLGISTESSVSAVPTAQTTSNAVQAIPTEKQEEVSNLLTSIAPEKLGLYSDISNYDLAFSAETTKIEGKTFYNVQAINATSVRHEIMGMYFIATDNTAVYKYDILTNSSTAVDLS